MENDIPRRVTIDRPLYDQEQFNKVFKYEKPDKSFLDSVYNSCTSFKPSKVLLKTIPVLQWLPHYKWKEDFFGDLASGITVAIMHIPQGMAYSLLGNVPAIVGIYMAFFPVLVYFFLGTSRHNSMGTFAIVCLMTGKTVLEHSRPQIAPSFVNSTSVKLLNDDYGYTPIEVATIVTFTVALFQLLMYILRLGMISTLLSETLVSGFTTGSAFQVLTSQLKDIFGLKIPKSKGYFIVIKTLWSIFDNIGDVNYVAIIIAAITITVTVLNNEVLKPRVAKKCSFPIPIELIVVVVGTVVSQYWNMEDRFNIDVVGDIPSGMPIPTVPPFSLMRDIVIDALTIALVAYALSLSMALIFAQKFSYEVDANQELLAQGAGNIFGSFFSCMPFTASISRSLIQQTVGGKTQLTSLISCSIIFLVLMWIGPLFEPLPKCILASVIVVALKGMLIQVTQLYRFWKLSKIDGLVWLITFLTVVFIGVDIGLLVGLVMSLITIILLSFKPQVCLLGLIPYTDIYLDVNRYKMASEIAGIKIFHYGGGINFASRNIYKSELYRLVKMNPQQEFAIRKKLVKAKESEELSASNASIQRINNKIEKLKKKTNPDLKCIVLDFSSVTYIDPSGITMIKALGEEFCKLDIPVYIAGCNGPVFETMQKCDLVSKKNFIKVFPTIHDAVQSASTIYNTNGYTTINTI